MFFDLNFEFQYLFVTSSIRDAGVTFHDRMLFERQIENIKLAAIKKKVIN